MNHAALYETLDPAIMHGGELAPRAYFIPFDKTQDPALPRTESHRLQLLNGDWAFRFCPDGRWEGESLDPMTAELPDLMPVPGVWQIHGYDHLQYTNIRFPFAYDPPYVPADNPCGIYRRTLQMNKKSGQKYSLVFEGVDSCLFLYVNGQYIGCTQVAHSPAEFDVTEALTDGCNTVAAVVYKWCFGSYLEDQDKFRYTGIFRDVYLLERDAVHVRDFTVTAEPDDDSHRSATVKVTAELTGEAPVQVCLTAPDGSPAGKAELKDGSCTFSVASPLLWTAETPFLYTLTLSCGTEIIAQKVGIRKIEIRDEKVYLNGSLVRFRGVDMHESSCETGAYTSMEHIRRDVLMMKKHNINAVRTSHYPQPPYFYQLANELGLYVLDEADQECHGVITQGDLGLKNEAINLMTNDPVFGPAILDRVQRLVYRDRNQPCVMIWSMGNESGHGVNTDRALAWTKATDPTRLTHYECASFPPFGGEINRTDLDLYSRMYPSLETIDDYFRKHTVQKPMILCEYCHAMGNGPGDLEDYYRVFEAEDRICGAFVWEWCEHAPLTGINARGQKMFRYGGDFGETLHDGNFCADGLVSSDRTPHPGLLEYRNVLRPVRIKNADLSNGMLTLKNCLDFTEPADLIRIVCTLTDAAGQVTELELPESVLHIAPRQTGTVRIPAIPGGSCVLRMLQKQDMPWAEAGTLLGTEQAGHPEAKVAFPEKSAAPIRLPDDRSGRYLTLEGDGFTYVFDTAKALFKGIETKGQERLLAPMAYSIWRAPTDNDRYISRDWDQYRLRYADSNCHDTQVRQTEDGVVITCTLHIAADSTYNIISGKVIWTVKHDGRILFDANVDRAQFACPVPRFGLKLQLPTGAKQVRYFGYGPYESYIDKHQADILGWFDTEAGADYNHLLKPQEGGSHYATQVLEVGDGENRMTVSGLFSHSVMKWSDEQLADVKHDDELTEEPVTFVHLDLAMAGIGSNSCGPRMLKAYEVPQHVSGHLELYF